MSAVARAHWNSRPLGARSGSSRWRIVLRWLDARRQRAALKQLDPHLLEDIGVTRAEAAAETSRPFWDVTFH